MQTTLSSKGPVVLPGPIRRKLGLRPGDVLAASVEDGRITELGFVRVLNQAPQ